MSPEPGEANEATQGAGRRGLSRSDNDMAMIAATVVGRP
jgi:hypothetical protein